jgi:hypothetical protein
MNELNIDPLYFKFLTENLILDERERQIKEWGKNDVSQQKWINILTEELEKTKLDTHYLLQSTKTLVKSASIIYQIIEYKIEEDRKNKLSICCASKNCNKKATKFITKEGKVKPFCTNCVIHEKSLAQILRISIIIEDIP